jgi:DNA polymerase-1
MLAASILDPQLDKNLGYLVNAEFHAQAHTAAYKTDKETGLPQGTWDSTDPAVERERREYCLKDAYTTLLVWQRQKERLQTYGRQQYDKLKRKAPIANAMRSRGMPFDYRYQAKMKAYHEGKREKIRAQMRAKLAPILPDFNPGSTKQVGKLFYNVCKIAPFAWTPEGTPSTDEDAIIEILKADNSLAVECADKILEYRNHDKMLGTYVVGGAPVDDSGLVFGDWKCHTAVSGRWSCTKYRLPDGTKAGMPFQVIPARIRRLFRARPGMVFVEADYNALEIRTLALLSGARHMLQMLEDGVDLHLENARQMFGDKTIVKKSPLRQAAKVIAFSSHYGAGPDTVWRTMIADDDIKKWRPGLTVRQVEAMQKAYFKIHGDIPLWWKRNVEEATARGYLLEPVFGRRLAFYGQVDFSLAQNFPNQSLALEIMDDGLVKIYDELVEPEGIVAQIHDSLGLEGPDGQRLKGLCTKHMPTTITFEGRTMHFPIEVKVSERYVWVK